MNSFTAASEINRPRPRVFTPAARAGSDRLFRAAVRHSRRVRLLRVAIPAGVVIALAGGIAVTALLKPLSLLSKLPVDLGSLVVSGSKIMMQQPRLAGFTRDNRRYDLTAKAAGQDLTKPDIVELQGIHATMEMQDRVVFQTTAQNGQFNNKTEQLTLSQDIVVTSSNGYLATLSEAVVDVRAGKIVSEKPVEVKTATWTVNANRMEIADAGNLMRFESGVSVTLVPENPAPETNGGARP
jgi:lipopolysaccharide export system protein LptC